MSELLRVLADEAVDDEALQEAAAAAEAILEVRGVDVEGVAPVLHEGASAAGQQAIDDAVAAGDEPELELIVSPIHGDARRLRVGPNPDPGAPYLLTEATWTGCTFDPDGTERLERVEIDGDIWHEADRDGVAETEAGP